MIEEHYDRNGWKRVCNVLTGFDTFLETKEEIILCVEIVTIHIGPGQRIIEIFIGYVHRSSSEMCGSATKICRLAGL